MNSGNVAKMFTSTQRQICRAERVLPASKASVFPNIFPIAIKISAESYSIGRHLMLIQIDVVSIFYSSITEKSNAHDLTVIGLDPSFDGLLAMMLVLEMMF